MTEDELFQVAEATLELSQMNDPEGTRHRVFAVAQRRERWKSARSSAAEERSMGVNCREIRRSATGSGEDATNSGRGT